MKKIIWGILILGILCSGCKNRDFEMDWDKIENMTMETTEDPAKKEWTQEEKTENMRETLLAQLDEGIYKRFYCVDFDHDNEKEIVILAENSFSESVYFDFINGKTKKRPLPDFVHDEVLNQKGYFQKIDYSGEEVSYVKGYDMIGKNELIFNYGECIFNGEIISRAECEEWVDFFVAEPTVAHTFTEQNILKYVNIELNDITSKPIKLLSDDKVEDTIGDFSLMQKAMLGVEKVYDTADKEMKWIWELPGYSDDLNFHYCDLDGDGKKEVIYLFYEKSILHEKDGMIYRYRLSDRDKIHNDGSIMSTSGASSWMLVIVKEFTNEEIVYETIYQYEDNICYKQYIYNGECILMTEEELAAIHEQYKEVRAELYEIQYNNIVNVVQ